MSKDDGSEAADAARRDEQARQDRIRQGTTRVNTIFDGTPSGTGAVGNFDKNATYYNADGSKWTPGISFNRSNPLAAFGGAFSTLGDILSGNGSAALTALKFSKLPADQQFAQLKSQGKLFSGTQKTGGFDDAFYKGRRDAYTNYAMPQLDQQNSDANKQLTFSLDRGGLLDSSVRGEKQSDLQRLYDTQKQAVADKALSYETGARNSVEDARANLISTLNATGDAEGAASSALARSKALTAPAAYDPLGQLFTDFTNGLGIQAAQERSYAAGGAKPAYNTGLFSNTGRVSVTG